MNSSKLTFNRLVRATPNHTYEVEQLKNGKLTLKTIHQDATGMRMDGSTLEISFAGKGLSCDDVLGEGTSILELYLAERARIDAPLLIEMPTVGGRDFLQEQFVEEKYASETERDPARVATWDYIAAQERGIL